MKKILIPIDFSKNSEIAYRYAIRLAHRISAELVVLNVYEQPNIKMRSLPNTLKEVYDDIESKEIEKFKHEVQLLNGIDESLGFTDVKKVNIIKHGEVKRTILSVVSSENIDLVIMGTQGHSAMTTFFLGSVTSYMLEHCRVPVLAIPPDMDASKRLNEFSFLTDFSDDAYRAMKWLVSLMESMSIDISSVHVASELDESDKKRWNETFDQTGKFYLIREENLVHGVEDFLDSHSVDAVAIVTHELNFFQGLFRTDKAKEIVKSKTIPVLGIPDSFVKEIKI